MTPVIRLLFLCALAGSTTSSDPEVFMDTIEIIKYWGYPAERVEVVTEDGYILQLHHIKSGRNQAAEDPNRPVVFLMHGLLAASDVWVSNLPNESAGMILLTPSLEAWFSWDEMATFDLPASIDAVLERTGQSYLYYVGHSQGTTILFARNSENQELKGKIRKHFALAPIATIKYMKGLFAFFAHYFYTSWQKKVTLLGSSDFLPSSWLTKPIPPEYNISNVNIDTYLFWGDKDYLADPQDVKQGLLPYLNPQILKGTV
uniref:AB hydrolase-1 domain-containing protein n=1 Tax=Steinernema glaseri TaxID=37863 RepID=A0A1I7YZV3_9BILA